MPISVEQIIEMLKKFAREDLAALRKPTSSGLEPIIRARNGRKKSPSKKKKRITPTSSAKPESVNKTLHRGIQSPPL